MPDTIDSQNTLLQQPATAAATASSDQTTVKGVPQDTAAMNATASTVPINNTADVAQSSVSAQTDAQAAGQPVAVPVVGTTNAPINPEKSNDVTSRDTNIASIDVSQTKTTETTDAMQTPRIYDTKEYIVPIHDTVHSHGAVGKIVAGAISAVVVLAIIVVLAYLII